MESARPLSYQPLRLLLMHELMTHGGWRLWHRYWDGLRSYLLVNSSKLEFDRLMRMIGERTVRAVCLHNQLISTILENVSNGIMIEDSIGILANCQLDERELASLPESVRLRVGVGAELSSLPELEPQTTMVVASSAAAPAAQQSYEKKRKADNSKGPEVVVETHPNKCTKSQSGSTSTVAALASSSKPPPATAPPPRASKPAAAQVAASAASKRPKNSAAPEPESSKGPVASSASPSTTPKKKTPVKVVKVPRGLECYMAPQQTSCLFSGPANPSRRPVPPPLKGSRKPESRRSSR